jgi:tight adherence protein B
MDDLLYRFGGSALAAGAAFFAVVGFRLPVRRLVARQEAAFHQALTELFMFDVTPRQLTYVMFAASLVAGAILGLFGLQAGADNVNTFLLFLAGVALGYWVPRLVIFVLQRRRRRQLNEQLIDGLVTLSNGMRAGLNLVQSMRLIEQNAQPPISQEFGLMLREYEHGTSVDDIMKRASAHIKLHHYKLLFAAMETARVRGGNLPETLDRLGESLREILRLEEKVRALTAQNQMSALMMGAMPFVIGCIYYLIDPSFIDDLLHDQWGLLMLSIAAFLNLVGFLWIRKIVTFEI